MILSGLYRSILYVCPSVIDGNVRIFHCHISISIHITLSVLKHKHKTSTFKFSIPLTGVFGGLDLFGRDVGRTWTQLASTANVGDNTLVLSDSVQWQAGDDIVLAPTSYNVWETESFRITSVASDNVTLTLNDTLKYMHVGRSPSHSQNS